MGSMVVVMKDKGKEMMMQGHCYSPRYASLITLIMNPASLTDFLHVSSDKALQKKEVSFISFFFSKKKKKTFGRGRGEGSGGLIGAARSASPADLQKDICS